MLRALRAVIWADFRKLLPQGFRVIAAVNVGFLFKSLHPETFILTCLHPRVPTSDSDTDHLALSLVDSTTGRETNHPSSNASATWTFNPYT